MQSRRKRVLMVGTYPILRPLHGGQRRVRAIFDAYCASFDARYIGVYHPPHYRWAGGRGDIPLGAVSQRSIERTPILEDLFCGWAIHADPSVRRRLYAVLDSFKPDVVQVEQCYPWLGLERMLLELQPRPIVIYSSQNVEAPLKADIYRGSDLAADDRHRAANLVERVELSLTRASDLVLAVSRADGESFRAMGAKRVLVVANGAQLPTASVLARRRWVARWSREGVSRTLLFVGSAHPPNLHGFDSMIGRALGFLSADTRLVIAGGVSRMVQSSMDLVQPAEVSFWRRAVAVPKPSDRELGSLLRLASAIVLPITEGGGSNIKTAEALLSGRPVVATTHAMRGYEAFREFPTVRVHDTSDSFRAAMVAAARSQPPDLRVDQQIALKQLEWPSITRELVRTMEEM